MQNRVAVRLFGDFTLQQDDRLVAGLDSPRLQALLAYLLLHRHAPQLRQHLAFIFWPDSDEPQARTNLRNLLHRLRQIWPDADRYLAIRTRSIGWKPEAEIELDVAQFEKHLKQAQAAEEPQAQLQYLEQALTLYRAELLPGCYDEWILPERAHLHQTFLQALETAVGLCEQQGDLQGAILYCHRLIQIEPLQEAAYRHLMSLYIRSGDRAAALRIYYRCVTTLRRELNIAPDTDTQATYQHLLSPGASLEDLPTSVVPAEASLVGRSLEWEQLLLAWRQVAAGKRPPLLALICGEAGVGKSRLAAELIAWVERQGIICASAHCYAPEAELSLVPVVSWLRALSLDGLAPIWRAELARLLPELIEHHPDEAAMLQENRAVMPVEPWQKHHFYEALTRAALSQKQPILLRLEDIHWSDPETLSWLHYLLHQGSNARLMVVATLRMEELNFEGSLLPVIAALRQQERLLEIDLHPLGVDETATLAATLLGETLRPEIALALHRFTEGNPLFIIETIRSGLEGGTRKSLDRLLSETQTWQMAEPARLPPKIQAILRERLAHLSHQARIVLETASVVGRSFTSEILLQASGAGEGELVMALDELWRRRIIREREGDAYDFSHDMLRQATYHLLSPARRRWLHGRVAIALEGADYPPPGELAGRLAFHYEAAGQAQKALHYHRLAARNARRLYAYQEASEHLRRAIELLDRTMEPPATSTQLYEQLGDVLSLSGQHEDARRAFEAASSFNGGEDQPTSAVLIMKSAQTWLAQYELTTAMQAFEEALQRLGQPESFSLREWRIWLDIRLGQLDLLYFLADLAHMAEMLVDIQPTLEQHGSLAQRANFAHLRVQLESRQRRFLLDEEVVAISQMALRLAEQTGDEKLVQRSHFGLGFVLLWSGQVEAAIAVLSQTVTSSQAAGNIPLLDRCLAYLAVGYRLLGDNEKVRELLPRCQAVAESEKNALYLGVSRAHRAWLDYRVGKYTQVGSHVRFALQQWEKLVFPFHWLACWPALAVAFHQADVETALGYANVMLKAEQQKLPDELEMMLTTAVAAYPQQPQKATQLLEQALTLAQANNYL